MWNDSIFKDVETFLDEVNNLISEDGESLLVSASMSKEYLSDFFYNCLSEFCFIEFNIGKGGSPTYYSKELITLKVEDATKKKIVQIFRDILYNRSDYLEQEYLEIAHKFQEFIDTVFPNLLLSLEEYLKNKNDTTSDKVSTLLNKWKEVFNGK